MKNTFSLLHQSLNVYCGFFSGFVSLGHRTTLWHTRSWSWFDRGQSPRCRPGRTPRRPARTPFTLRSSSRKNSCKVDTWMSRHLLARANIRLPDWAEWHPEDCIYEPIGMAFRICLLWLRVRSKMLVNEGFCVSSAQFHSSAALFRGFIIVLFCLLAWLACEPDVLRNALTVNYFVSTQEAAWKKNQKRTVAQALLLQCHRAM